jgi:hypothetical protein
MEVVQYEAHHFGHFGSGTYGDYGDGFGDSSFRSPRPAEGCERESTSQLPHNQQRHFTRIRPNAGWKHAVFSVLLLAVLAVLARAAPTELGVKQKRP